MARVLLAGTTSRLRIPVERVSIVAATGRSRPRRRGGVTNACAPAAPDIVILDMNAPVIDGWTIADILKRDPQTRQIPIIALTWKPTPPRTKRQHYRRGRTPFIQSRSTRRKAVRADQILLAATAG